MQKDIDRVLPFMYILNTQNITSRLSIYFSVVKTQKQAWKQLQNSGYLVGGVAMERMAHGIYTLSVTFFVFNKKNKANTAKCKHVKSECRCTAA